MTQEHSVMDAPPPGFGGSNGANPKTPPSLEDFFLLAEKGNPNILLEFITSSVNAQEFIPRAILTKRQAAALQRFSTSTKIFKEGAADVGMIVWQFLVYSISIDGRARQQVAEMYSGLGSRIREQFMGIGQSGPGEPRQRTR